MKHDVNSLQRPSESAGGCGIGLFLDAQLVKIRSQKNDVVHFEQVRLLLKRRVLVNLKFLAMRLGPLARKLAHALFGGFSIRETIVDRIEKHIMKIAPKDDVCPGRF